MTDPFERSNRDTILRAETPPSCGYDEEQIPEGLTSWARFVCWKWNWTGTKWSKRPVQVNGRLASTTDPSTWSEFSEVIKASRRMNCGIGFVFNGDGIVGIDLDDCREPDTGKVADWAEDIIRQLNSYSEVSPTKTGIKIFVRGTLPNQFRKNYRHPSGTGAVEVYNNARYFALTGFRTPASPDDLRHADLSELLAGLGSWISKKTQPTVDVVRNTNGRGTAVAALKALDPSMGYNDWVKVGMAMHSIDPSHAMFAEWDSWSKGSDKYAPGETEQKWKSFRPNGGVGVGTLCQMADDTRKSWRPDLQKSYPHADFENSENSETVDQEWGAPVPLSTGGDIEPFPVEALPEVLCDYVEELAEFTQTPPDLAGGMVLAVCATALQKKFVVEPMPGWTEPLNLYVVSMMDPASRKSAVVTATSAPIREFEKSEQERLEPEIRKLQSERELWKKQRDRLMEDCAKCKADHGMLRHEIEKLDLQIAEHPVILAPRLLADDVTPETLSTLMTQHHGRMAVLTAEGDLFYIMCGRYSSGAPNLGIYLRAHSGDEVRVDRKNRPSELIRDPALTIGCCVQPEVMRGLMRKQETKGLGLQARFLFQMPESIVGYRKIKPNRIDPSVKQAYETKISQLLNIECLSTPVILRLSSEGDLAFTEFRSAVEDQLAPGGELSDFQDWSGKLCGAVARLAGILHLVKYASASKIPTQISDTTMSDAIRLGWYFVSHAKRAFSFMESDPKVAIAEKVLRVVQRHQWAEFSRRDLHQQVKSSIKNQQDLDTPLRLLEDHNYIRSIPSIRSGPGRKPSERFEVHPQIAPRGVSEFSKFSKWD